MTTGQLAVAFFAVGMAALVVGTMVPGVIEAQDAESRDTTLLSEGESVTYDEVITITMDNVNNPSSYVNLTVRDEGTQATVLVNLTEGETKTVTPVDDPVTITLDRIEGGNSADVTPSFSRTYGWNEGAQIFLGELDTMLTVVGFVFVVGALGSELRA